MKKRKDATTNESSRKHYSVEFKRKVISACKTKDNSIAKIADSFGLNPSMVRRWVNQASESESPGFIPLPRPDNSLLSDSSLGQTVDGDSMIHLDVSMGDLMIHVQWPVSHANNLPRFLKELSS